MQLPQEREGRNEERNVIGDVEPRQSIMQVRSIDAPAWDGIVPVLGNRDAGDYRRQQAEEAVCGQPYDEAEENTLGDVLRENASALQ